ncbi:MAG: flagellar basal body rod protein FlgB [Phycisphaerae bacterium]|nr:flagellar basal body rod protein FlgB [Phycisphaerae bacterium]
MIFESLLNRGSMPVLQQVMSFTEARHEVLANNVSNFDTVGYKMQDLAKDEFFAELNRAIKQRDAGGAGAQLEMRNTSNIKFNNNSLRASVLESESNNILFHDKNNRSVEKQMAEMAKNTIMHDVVAELLRGKYNGLQTAIRGTL